MNMGNPLVPGTIQKIYEQGPTSVESPCLQVIHLKNFEKGDNVLRYKIVLSDSKNFMQGVLATELNHLVESKVVELNSIIRLSKFVVNSIKNHRLIWVTEIVTSDVIKGTSRIGEPLNIDSATNNGSSNAPVNSAFSAPATKPVYTSNTVANAPASNSGFKPSSSTPSHSNPAIQLISALSPYKDRNTINARVTTKTEVKKWINERGEGRLFSVNLLDSSGEIRLTCFNDAVDQYFDLLQVGKVYEFSNFQVKIAKRKFGVDSDYELSVDSNTTIKAVLEEVSEIPKVHYSFIPISKILEKQKDDVLDVIGIVKECGDLAEITVKSTQKQLIKRDLTLVDTSLASVRLTLWGKQAQDFNEQEASSNPVIAIKGVRVNEYQGKTLSTSGNSQITFNPDISEAHTLRGWFDSNGGKIETSLNVSSQASSNTPSVNNNRDDRKFLSQVKNESLGQHDKPDYFSTVSSVSFIKSDNGSISYMACPTEGCNKKVIEEGPNQYRCEKCQKVFDRCDHRYIMSVQISDASGAIWVQAFNETGHQLLEKTAEEMYHLKMNNDQLYQQTIKDCYFKTFLFRIKGKLETYQGEAKPRFSIMSASSIDYEKDSQSMINRLENYYQS